MTQKFYGKGLPVVNTSELRGCLIVIEGSDGSGRSTQVRLLRDALERLGYPTAEFGLKRSTLVGPELNEAMEGNVLGPTTLSLFYATDFADQLEKSVIPALRAGFVVTADRYIYSLMARDIVRGAAPEWIQAVYGIALVPDLVLYLDVPPLQLVERSFRKLGQLSYWESGMDIQRSGDMYECFIRYQRMLTKEYRRMAQQFKFETIRGWRSPLEVHDDIKIHIDRVLKARKVAPIGASINTAPDKARAKIKRARPTGKS